MMLKTAEHDDEGVVLFQRPASNHSLLKNQKTSTTNWNTNILNAEKIFEFSTSCLFIRCTPNPIRFSN